jgi:hypothetical protein
VTVRTSHGWAGMCFKLMCSVCGASVRVYLRVKEGRRGSGEAGAVGGMGGRGGRGDGREKEGLWCSQKYWSETFTFGSITAFLRLAKQCHLASAEMAAAIIPKH